jgi:hypothetical protein
MRIVRHPAKSTAIRLEIDAGKGMRSFASRSPPGGRDRLTARYWL